MKSQCRQVFKEIADKFTLNCINELFASVKREIDLQNSAITLENQLQFLFLISFFLDYFALTKTNDNQFDQVTGVMNQKFGFYIFSKLSQFKFDKEHLGMFFAVKALNSFLVGLKNMFTSKIEALQQMAIYIQSSVFYEQEHLILVSSLCKDSKPRSLIYMKSVMQLSENIFELLQVSNTDQIVTRTKSKKVSSAADSDESEAEVNDEQGAARREKLFTLAKLENVYNSH